MVVVEMSVHTGSLGRGFFWSVLLTEVWRVFSFTLI